MSFPLISQDYRRTDWKKLQTLAGSDMTLLNSAKVAERRLPPRIDVKKADETKEMMDKLKGMGNSLLGLPSHVYRHRQVSDPSRQIRIVNGQFPVYAKRRGRLLYEFQQMTSSLYKPAFRNSSQTANTSPTCSLSCFAPTANSNNSPSSDKRAPFALSAFSIGTTSPV